MIQIEMIEIKNNNGVENSHVCQVVENNVIVGKVFLSVGSTHGRLDRSELEPDRSEYLDGLVKTAIHQLFWKGLYTGSYRKSDELLMEYFKNYDFTKEEMEEEYRFVLEDFIQAARCSHG